MYQDRTEQDTHLMQEALSLAARALGRTSPNPPVGCVIYHHGRVVGRGFHPKAGEPHAEVFALKDAGDLARGSTVYVTLEPCSHHGRTPPCADALIEAGVRRVVVAALDPNPLVSGKGVEKLRNAGIQVAVGVLQEQATVQQAGFRTRIVQGRPRVTYKFAQTLDGKMAPLQREQVWLTGLSSRRFVHELRNQTDAIAVGSGTVLMDHPQLTTRLEGRDDTRDPTPVVFDRSGRVPVTAKVLREGAVVVTESQQVYPEGIRVIRSADLREVLQELGTLGINSLLLEGGPTLASAFLKAHLIDDLLVFITPKIMGTGLSSIWTELSGLQEVHGMHAENLEEDVLLRAFLNPIPGVEG
ncbi:riboflavin biosynthesis protein RibD [Deinococcus roseus]|uniref:Riboflavin biosynthesis protein RibD n=1 Tax=Deinococcus roseus TaxID=392414 RepID=A0ABQ2CT79_9DEIO|nr:riboflavin biosynthesis protein RibD [Deinococcus roseus]